MKYRHFLAILAVPGLLLFSQCKKQPDDSMYNASFYKTQDRDKLLLFVNGANKGELPYFPEKPQCDQRNSEGAAPVKLTLPSGEYQIEARDTLGRVRTCSVMFISRKESSLSSGKCGGSGGAEMFNSGDCLIYGLIAN